MKRYLVLILGLFLPMFAVAQSISGFNLFDPSAIKNGTDLSISYLGDIYGVVDGILHGSGSQIMGRMFAVFNAGALLLGGIIVIYTSALSLLNTANEGELLGKKWNSVWIPLRTVLGIALLIPKSTGYCAIQIFMMWVIVQGVGLADTVWNSVTTYLMQGGVIVQQSLAPQKSVTSSGAELFRQTVCLAGLQTAFNQAYLQALKQNPPTIPNFLSSISPLKATCKNNTCTALLPDFKASTGPNQTDWSKLNGVCGEVTWKELTPSAKAKAEDTSDAKNTKDAYEKSMRVGTQQMLLDFSPPSQAVVSNLIYPPSGVSQNKDVKSYVSKNVLVNAASDYEGIVSPAQKAAVSGAQQKILKDVTKFTKATGWIDAGAFYQVLANQNNDISSTLFTPPSGTSRSTLKNDLKRLNQSGIVGSPLAQYINFSPLITELSDSNSAFNKFLNDDVKTGQKGKSKNAGKAAVKGVKVGGVIADVLQPMLSPLIDIIQSFVELTTSGGTVNDSGQVANSGSNANPVVAIALMGYGLIGLVTEVWVVGAITLASVTGTLTIIPSITEGTTVNVVTEWLIPFLWGICGLLFVEGAVMAFYVPLIPFILFLFGAIGWLIATLEAMVAAPLVALGITHPEGAEVLGKSDPAVLLLVNVFLRPSMMIIGFIGGIILSYVSVWLLNVGFFTAFGLSLGVGSGASTSAVLDALITKGIWILIFGFPAMLIIYVGLVVILLNYSFSLINVIPDKVMRWIGGQVEGVAGEANRMLGESKSGMQQAGKALSDTTKDIAGKAGDREQKSHEGKGKIETGPESSKKKT